MFANFDDTAVIHHDDCVGPGGGAQSVRDDESGAVASHSVDRFDDLCFFVVADIGRRFVQQHDRWLNVFRPC